jgi:hypothetical protein
LKAHSCNEGLSALADTKAPEALQTSSDTRYFTSSAGEIEICAVIGKRIETTKAVSINMALNFIGVYFGLLS